MTRLIYPSGVFKFLGTFNWFYLFHRILLHCLLNERRHEKTYLLHKRKQRRGSAERLC